MQEPFRKKKKYGQNFLIGNTVVKRIVAGSGIDADCGVLEIGPGAGALTRELLSAAKRVVSVEIDGELIPILENLSLIHISARSPDGPSRPRSSVHGQAGYNRQSPYRTAL